MCGRGLAGDGGAQPELRGNQRLLAADQITLTVTYDPLKALRKPQSYVLFRSEASLMRHRYVQVVVGTIEDHVGHFSE